MISICSLVMSFNVTSMMSHCYTFSQFKFNFTYKYWSNSPLLGEIVAKTSMSSSVKNQMKKVGSKFRPLCTLRKNCSWRFFAVLNNIEKGSVFTGINMEPFSIVGYYLRTWLFTNVIFTNDLLPYIILIDTWRSRAIHYKLDLISNM